jgi:hypothetical protein
VTRHRLIRTGYYDHDCRSAAMCGGTKSLPIAVPNDLAEDRPRSALMSEPRPAVP